MNLFRSPLEKLFLRILEVGKYYVLDFRYDSSREKLFLQVLNKSNRTNTYIIDTLNEWQVKSLLTDLKHYKKPPLVNQGKNITLFPDIFSKIF
jgi:hypothetical protein